MDYNMKKIFIISIICTVVLQFLIYIFFLRNSVKEIIILDKEIENQNLLYQNILENYVHLEKNKYLFTTMEEESISEIVDIGKLPHAIVNISNLMVENNIKEDIFNIGHIQSIDYIQSIESLYDEILLLPIHISGVGNYDDIMNYLRSLNYTTYLYLIDSLKIIKTLEDEVYYLYLNVFIVVGNKYE